MCTLPPAIALIAGGRFLIGDGREQSELIEQAFHIAHYPVTNAQYAQFMADNGYNPDKPWWDAAGRAWLTRDDAATTGLESWQRRTYKDQPKYWESERLGIAHPNYPIVGVS